MPASSVSFSYFSKFLTQSCQLKVGSFPEGSLQDCLSSTQHFQKHPYSQSSVHFPTNPDCTLWQKRASLTVVESPRLPSVLHDLECHLSVPLVHKQLNHLLEGATSVALVLGFPSELPKLSTNLRHAYIGNSQMKVWFFLPENTWNGFLPGNVWRFSPISFWLKSYSQHYAQLFLAPKTNTSCSHKNNPHLLFSWITRLWGVSILSFTPSPHDIKLRNQCSFWVKRWVCWGCSVQRRECASTAMFVEAYYPFLTRDCRAIYIAKPGTLPQQSEDQLLKHWTNSVLF